MLSCSHVQQLIKGLKSVMNEFNKGFYFSDFILTLRLKQCSSVLFSEGRENVGAVFVVSHFQLNIRSEFNVTVENTVVCVQVF